MSFLLNRLVRGSQSGGAGSPTTPSSHHLNSPQSQEQRIAIEKLCNRLVNASLVEDRRSSAQTLKSLAKQCYKELGRTGITPILTAITRDEEDQELVKFLLETLSILLITAAKEDLDRESAEFAQSLAEIILKDERVLEVALRHLGPGPRALRFAVIQFLRVLEEVLPVGHLAGVILRSPRGNGVARLVAAIEPPSSTASEDEAEEIIRQETRALLRQLAGHNPEIQRMAAFEGAFEKLFSAAIQEGSLRADSSTSTAVDSLCTVRELLRGNASNQNYFLESPCLRQLCNLLSLPSESSSRISPFRWEDELDIIDGDDKSKEDGLIVACEIIQILLEVETPTSPAIQSELFKIGFLTLLVRLILEPSITADCQIAALRTLGMIVYRNTAACNELQNLLTPHPLYEQSVPIIIAIISLALEPSRHWQRRKAAVDLLGAFLSRNPDGQLAIAGTFQSPTLSDGMESAIPSITSGSAGSIIIYSLLDKSNLYKGKKSDPWRVALAALLLAHVLANNSQCKTIALAYRSQKDESEDGDQIPLLTASLNILEETVKNNSDGVSVALSILQLICIWIDDSREATREFLIEGRNVHLLMELTGQNSSAHPLIQGMAALMFLLLIKNSQGLHGTQQLAFNRYNKFVKQLSLIVLFRDGLLAVVKSRIGLEVFLGRIHRLHRRLLYFYAQNDNDLVKKEREACYFDNHFIELFLQQRQQLLSLLWPEKAISHGIDQSVQTIDFYDFAPPNDIISSSEKTIQSAEIERFQQLISMYQQQLLEEEQEHEEMMSALAAQDNEIAQLRELLARDREGQLVHDSDLSTSSMQSLTELPVTPVKSQTIPSSINHNTGELPQGELYTQSQSGSIQTKSPRNTIKPSAPSTITHDV